MPSVLAKRLKAGKESSERMNEKLGFYKLRRSKGRLIWFHVASVGELNSIIQLVKSLEADYNVLITTITLNASKVFEKAEFKNTIHQFAPLDTPQIVKKFLGHWNPDVGVFIDSELWPNLLNASSKRFKVINLNARLSDRSAKKWGCIKGLASYVYGKFFLVLPCSSDDMRKISAFVPKNKLQFIGNLKLATTTTQPPKAELSTFKKLLANKLLIVAASTHPGEEEVILDAFKLAKKQNKDAFLIIAPRNPSRGEEIKAICDAKSLLSSIRSKSPKFHSKDSVYIADTIGEMVLWYTLGDIAIVGGSFVPHGGHNIVEPAKLNNAIITGTHTHNFRDIIGYFLGGEAVIIANNGDLGAELCKLVEDAKYRKTIAAKAYKLADASEVLEKAKAIVVNSMK
jgi:3-deoxy-D-manno-octulosonic-acid transferase